MELKSETRIIDLTWGELKDAILGLLQEQPRNEHSDMIKGIAGIMEEFKCSQRTASRLKDGILAPAVQQAGKGCTVLLDREFAKKLYKQYKNQ